MINIERLKKQKEDLQKSFEEACKTSIEMDSKMQSRYDTQKEDWARRAEIIEHLIIEIQKQINYLESLSVPGQTEFAEIGHAITLQDRDDVFCLLLVDGIGGGIKLENIQVVSIEAPVGKALLGRRQGDIISVLHNDEKIELKILAISIIT
jgi:transcription elongation GreA/GreB family factor